MRPAALLLWLLSPVWGQQGMVLPTAPKVTPADELLVSVAPDRPWSQTLIAAAGELAVSAASDGTVVYWSATTAVPQAVVRPFDQGLAKVAVAAAGDRVAVADADGQVQFLDGAGQAVGEAFEAADSGLAAMAFQPDGARLATSAQREIRLWPVGGGEPRALESPITASVLLFDPEGRWLMAAGAGETLALWLFDAGIDPRRINLSGIGSVHQLAVSRAGDWLAVLGDQGTLAVYRLRTLEDGRLRPTDGETLQATGGARINAVAFVGEALLLATDAGVLEAWDTASRSLTYRQPIAIGPISGLGTSGERGLALLRGEDGTAVLWDLPAARAIGELTGQTHPLANLAWSPDGRYLAASAEPDRLYLWDLERTNAPRVLTSHLELCGLAFLPNSASLIAVSRQGWLQAWKTATGATAGEVAVAGGPAGLAIDPGGTVVAVPCSDGVLRRFDIADGTALGVWRGPGSALTTASYSADGRLLAAGCQSGQTAVLQAGDGLPLAQWQALPATVRDLQFLDGGASLLVAGDGPTQLWDAATGTAIRTLTGAPAQLGAAAADPEEQMLAVLGPGGELALLPLTEGGREPWVASDQRTGLGSLAWRPGGQAVAATGLDGAIGLYAAADGRRLARLWPLYAGRGWLSAADGVGCCCSADAERLLHWRIGNTVFPYEHRAGEFRRPAAVAAVWLGQAADREPDLVDTAAQIRVVFAAPRSGCQTDATRLYVVLDADGHEPVQRVDLTVNGEPVPPSVAALLNVPQPDARHQQFKVSVPLTGFDGVFRIRAVAYDRDERPSPPAELVVYRPGAKRNKGELHVLAIGIDQYQDPAFSSLTTAAADAEAVGGAFERQANSQLYTQYRYQVLTDSQATLPRIKQALELLETKVDEEDTAVIFLSGHGTRFGDGTYCFITHDTRVNQPDSALSWKTFVEALLLIRARTLLLVTDTCHDGGMFASAGLTADDFPRINPYTRRLVLTACRADQVSIGLTELGHGAFTQALLDSLAGPADTNADGLVSFRELARAAIAGTKVLTAGSTVNGGEPQVPQVPFFDRDTTWDTPLAAVGSAAAAEPH